MVWVDVLLGGIVAVFAGLDRTALLQMMISRPIVAAPLTGWLLGDAEVGLQVGAMVELLWLSRLPVGAAIPPDDTQIAIGATTLVAGFGPAWGYSGWGFAVLSLLVAMPLGKFGQLTDHWARERNSFLQHQAETALEAGNDRGIEHLHLQGLMNFGLAALANYLVIVALGALLLRSLTPSLLDYLDPASGWLRLCFPLVGAAVVLGAININRSLTLFGASFTTVLLVMWLT